MIQHRKNIQEIKGFEKELEEFDKAFAEIAKEVSYQVQYYEKQDSPELLSHKPTPGGPADLSKSTLVKVLDTILAGPFLFLDLSCHTVFVFVVLESENPENPENYSPASSRWSMVGPDSESEKKENREGLFLGSKQV